jgi:hypothetical protein
MAVDTREYTTDINSNDIQQHGEVSQEQLSTLGYV